jgi:DNA-binding MarR family transcriptional regulator
MEPRWLDEREQRAWRAFLDLVRVLTAGMERQHAENGVSGADYALLVPLSEAPGRRLRPRDLAASTGWDRSRLAHQLRRMEDRRLVAREECATDGRGTVVWLTDTGLDVLRRAAPGHVEWVRTHFIDQLTDEELDTLCALSERVVSRLKREQPSPTGSVSSGEPR